jgi:hypothetical protein
MKDDGVTQHMNQSIPEFAFIDSLGRRFLRPTRHCTKLPKEYEAIRQHINSFPDKHVVCLAQTSSCRHDIVVLLREL